MSIKIGVMWYPRKVEVFHKMKQSIGVDFTVYPDYETFKHQHESVKHLGGNVGCFKHYYRVLADLCNSDADYVAVFSDDVEYRLGWVDIALEKLQEDNLGFVSCYVPREIKHRFRLRNGWTKINKGWAGTYGGGYVFKRDVAQKILEHPFVIKHRDNYKKNQQIDHAIPQAVYEMGLDQWFYVPSLMNHIGYSSTIGHTHHNGNVGAGWPVK